MIEADPDLVAALDDLWRAHPDNEWEAASNMGLPWIGIAEDSGGVGGTIADQVAVAFAVGKYRVRAPIVETHLAAAQYAVVDRTFPVGPLAFSPGSGGDRVDVQQASGEFRDVAWAEGALAFVGVAAHADRPSILFAEADEFTLSDPAGRDLAGQPLATVTVLSGSSAPPQPAARLDHALLRAAQLAGAIEGIADLTQRYTNERVQFGKPVAAFQAVTQHLVVVEQAAVASRIVVEQATSLAAEFGRHRATFEIGATHLVVDHHARLALAAAHQAHGAIGMTAEYPLAHYARLMHTWRALARDHRVSAAHIGRDAIGNVARLAAREVSA